MNLEPNIIIEKAIQYIKGKNVLDLGVGNGRNAIFLALNGFKVTGIDKSNTMLKNVRNICMAKKIKLELIRKRIENFSYTKKYNAIFCLNVLHFIKKENIPKMISLMKSNTLEGGINVIQAFTTKDPMARTKPGLGYLKPNELKRYYKNWKTVHYFEYMSDPEKHKSNPKLHRHHIAEIIAIKK